MQPVKISVQSGALAAIGVIAFIDSFLPWYTVSEKSGATGLLTQYAASGNAWDVGAGAWIPMVALVAVGVMAALPAIGRGLPARQGHATNLVLAVIATVIVLLRWLTYPSIPVGQSAFIDAGADVGTYLGVLLGLAATGAAYLGFTANGGTLDSFTKIFRTPPA
ncbi:hypothetical protein ACFVSN_07560 [Kitasatospora sp. NPDC057904]|uniref:hypothetical protein n=1 Tax=Kitasatospora sp. NPDC057904 TaxID=3346275 RepID=UPI0036DCB63A